MTHDMINHVVICTRNKCSRTTKITSLAQNKHYAFAANFNLTTGHNLISRKFTTVLAWMLSKWLHRYAERTKIRLVQ